MNINWNEEEDSSTDSHDGVLNFMGQVSTMQRLCLWLPLLLGPLGVTSIIEVLASLLFLFVLGVEWGEKCDLLNFTGCGGQLSIICTSRPLTLCIHYRPQHITKGEEKKREDKQVRPVPILN